MTRVSQTRTSDLAYLGTLPRLPAFSVFLVRAAVKWADWRQLAQTRMTLKNLDPHLLRDVGIPYEEAMREAKKPFWMR